jgi:hypothetical protein
LKIHTACNVYLSKALFILGEIGGNDYSFMLFSNKTVDYVSSNVPTVVGIIKDAAEVCIYIKNINFLIMLY